MKKTLFIFASFLTVSFAYADQIHCPTSVYYDGYKLVVEDKGGLWDMFSYPADLKPGQYYFSYAKAFRGKAMQPAECGYDATGKYPPTIKIKLFGPKATIGTGAWQARTAEEWFCTYASCTFSVQFPLVTSK